MLRIHLGEILPVFVHQCLLHFEDPNENTQPIGAFGQEDSLKVFIFSQFLELWHVIDI